MFKKHDYTLGVLWAAAIFILPLPFIQTLEAGLPAIYYPQKLPIIAGTIAYVWLLLAIYLSTRPRRLDRLIGLPKVYMIHGIMSLGAILLAWLHMQGSPSAGLIKQTGNIRLLPLLGPGGLLHDLHGRLADQAGPIFGKKQAGPGGKNLQARAVHLAAPVKPAGRLAGLYPHPADPLHPGHHPLYGLDLACHGLRFCQLLHQPGQKPGEEQRGTSVQPLDR